MMVPPGKSWRELHAELSDKLDEARDQVRKLTADRGEAYRQWREAERALFEAYYGPMGIEFERSSAGRIAPEPWSEYKATDAGYLWAGWLGAKGLA